jgi:uncharacterized repeat protein (TIGR01451 family)
MNLRSLYRQGSRLRAKRWIDPSVERLEPRELLATFVVTSGADSGAGTLRQAILDANRTPETNTIAFNLPTIGPNSINPTSPLPVITGPIVVDGTTQPGYAGAPLVGIEGSNIPGSADGLVLQGGSSTVRGLIINRFPGAGIVITSDENVVQGNVIGSLGASPLASYLENLGDGLRILGSNNIIGGSTIGAGNVISLNHGAGIEVLSSSHNSFTHNSISLNGGAGISVLSGSANSFSQNSIWANGRLGIDLGGDGVTQNHAGGITPGPNGSQNFPVLTSVVQSGDKMVIAGTLEGSANTAYTVQFFASGFADPSGYGQGQLPFGQTILTTDDTGNAVINVTVPSAVPLGQAISATAADPAGNTSEFSRSVAFTSATSADLSVTYSATPAAVAAGSIVTFTIHVTNQGPNLATSVALAVSYPQGVSQNNTNVTTSQGTSTFVANGFDVSLGTLSANESATITFMARLTLGDANRTNAAVFGAQTDPDVNNNLATQTVDVLGGADLSITGAASPTSVTLGHDATVVFTVTNLGPATATGIELNAYIPGYFDPRTAVDAVGVFPSELGPLSPGASATVRVVVIDATALFTANGTGTLPVGFEILHLDEVDPDITNNTATANVDVVGSPDLSVTISPPTTPALVGERMTFTVSATNNGNAGATDSILTVTLPEGMQFVSGQTSFGTAVTQQSATVLTAAIGSLGPPGPLSRAFPTHTVPVTIVAVPTAPGMATLSASISETQTDANSSDNVASIVASVAYADRAPTVQGVGILMNRKVVSGFVLATSGTALNSLIAQNLNAYRLVSAGRDGIFGTRDDVPITAQSATYNPTLGTIVLIPTKAIRAGAAVQVTAFGTGASALTDVFGRPLETGDFTAIIGGASGLTYLDSNKNAVTLKLSGPGALELLRDASGDAAQLVLIGTSVHKSTLTGSVQKKRGGAKALVRIPTIVGLAQVRNRLKNPPFVFGERG